MNNIATSINQSQKLIDLGLSADTADMYWVTYENQTYLTSMDKEFDKRTDTYAWSLSRLLELMPYPSLHNFFNDEWRCDIHYDDGDVRKFGENGNSPLDAAFEMMVYLLENKLIK